MSKELREGTSKDGIYKGVSVVDWASLGIGLGILAWAILYYLGVIT